MTTATEPVQVVQAFLDAIEARDFERALGCLSAEGFSYVGPLDHFDSARAFIDDIASIGPILKRVERRRLFVDGNEVVAIVTFWTTIEEIRQTRVAHWLSVNGGRITRIEGFFDVRAYARMFDPER